MNRFRERLLNSVCFAPDGAGGGNDTTGGAGATVPGGSGNPTLPGGGVTPPNDDTAYITLLRRESQQHREAAAAAKASEEKVKADAAAAIAATTTAANTRIINAELRAEATKAGIVDIDGLKLLDLEKAGVKVDDAGNVIKVAEAIADLKKSKPFLFAAATTGNGTPVKPGEQTEKHARDMTPAERSAKLAELTRVRV